MALLCKLTDTSRFFPTGHARDSNSKRMLEVHTNRITQLLLLQSIHSDSSEKQCWGMFLHVSRKFKAVSRKVVSFQSVCVCLSVCLPACLAAWLAVCLTSEQYFWCKIDRLEIRSTGSLFYCQVLCLFSIRLLMTPTLECKWHKNVAKADSVWDLQAMCVSEPLASGSFGSRERQSQCHRSFSNPGWLRRVNCRMTTSDMVTYGTKSAVVLLVLLVLVEHLRDWILVTNKPFELTLSPLKKLGTRSLSVLAYLV